MARKTRMVRFEVTDEDAGRRLDQVLAARIEELSRRKARILLDIGGVFVDRKRVKVASRKLRPGQIVEAHIGGALQRATKTVGRKARADDARALPAFVVAYEDEDIVVVDKPAGLITAPTPESDRGNLADLLRRRQPSGTIYVVHRIDLGTSGLLVFAKTEAANRVLSVRFRDHSLKREYIAVVDGHLGGRLDRSDEIAVRVPISGRRAVTHLRALEHIDDVATVVRARLETGRTHQIRIHCSHLGHPVMGDSRHGDPTASFVNAPPRMALHATRLGIAHPTSGKFMDFVSPLPADLSAWLAALRTASD